MKIGLQKRQDFCITSKWCKKKVQRPHALRKELHIEYLRLFTSGTNPSVLRETQWSHNQTWNIIWTCAAILFVMLRPFTCRWYSRVREVWWNRHTHIWTRCVKLTWGFRGCFEQKSRKFLYDSNIPICTSTNQKNTPIPLLSNKLSLIFQSHPDHNMTTL